MQKPSLWKLITVSGVILLLTGCVPKPSGGTDSVASLQKMVSIGNKPRARQLTNIRRLAIQETALSLGAQSGLAWRAKQVNDAVKTNERKLDLVFNFNSMLLEHNVIPPVLVEARNTLNISDENALRISDRVYTIEKQARFVTTPPNWREYLSLNYENPARPDDSLLPKNLEERKIWNEFVAKGWKQGIEQANNIFSDNLARLKRDYKGMALYRNLLAQNMVSPPFVAKTDLGITGGGADMRVNDTVLRITALPGLQSDSKKWKPALSLEPAADIALDDKFIVNKSEHEE
ncbi:MAG: type IV secretion system DotC family protein [Proteobacteria bacterium]|nr:type IV secretion system DotC family protein [Pseudomonadota bacterium]